MSYKLGTDGTWECPSSGPANNGLVKECSFKFSEFAYEFDAGSPPNCPVCGTQLSWKSNGKTVSEYMREGMKKYK